MRRQLQREREGSRYANHEGGKQEHQIAAKMHKEAMHLHRNSGNEKGAKYHEDKMNFHIEAAKYQK